MSTPHTLGQGPPSSLLLFTCLLWVAGPLSDSPTVHMWTLKAWELSFQVAWWVQLGSKDLGPDPGFWYQGKAVLGQQLAEGKAWPSSTESSLLTASISWLLFASWGGNSRMFGFFFCRFLLAIS